MRKILIISTMVLIFFSLIGFNCKCDDDEAIKDKLTFSINPENTSISTSSSAPDSAWVTVYIQYAEELMSAKVKLKFTTSDVEVEDIQIDDNELTNALLDSDANTDIIVSDDYFDNATGEIILGALAQKTNFTGVSGDGAFAKILFRAKVSDPNSVLEITSTEAYKANGDGIAEDEIEIKNGNFQ